MESLGVGPSDEGSDEPLEHIQRHRHRERLADSIGKVTQDDYIFVEREGVSDDRPSEETNRASPLARKLRDVRRISQDLLTSAVVNVGGESVSQEASTGLVGRCGQGELLDGARENFWTWPVFPRRRDSCRVVIVQREARVVK